MGSMQYIHSDNTDTELKLPVFVPPRDWAGFDAVYYGNSTQNGTPTPQAPLSVNPTSGKVTLYGVDITLPELHGVGDIRDTFEPCVLINGTYRSRKTQWIGKLVLTGQTGSSLARNVSGANRYDYYISGVPGKIAGPGICTHFAHTGSMPIQSIAAGLFWAASISYPTALYFNMFGIVSGDNATLPDAGEANAWLRAQFAAGTPVTIYYTLATPIVTFSPLSAMTSNASAIDGCFLPAIEPNQLIFNGFSQQSGTPTPQAPLAVNPVGGTATVRSLNLFDIEGWWYNYVSIDFPETSETIIDNTRAFALTGGGGIVWIGYVPNGGYKANTQYTIRLREKSLNPSYPMRIHVRYYGGSLTEQIFQGSGEWEEIIFTTDPGKTIYEIYFGFMNGSSAAYIDKNSVMLVEGAYNASTMPPWEPYGGINLFDIVGWGNYIVNYFPTVSETVIDGAPVLSFGVITEIYTHITYNPNVGYKPNTQYTIKLRGKSMSFDNPMKVLFQYNDNVIIGQEFSLSGEWEEVTVTSEPNKTIATIQFLYDSNAISYIDRRSVMLVEGAYNAATMPPWGWYGEMTIALPELHGVGAYADTYEPCVWVNGAYRSRTTQRIKKVIVNGTTVPLLKLGSTAGTYSYNINTDTIGMRLAAPGLCTHFVNGSNINIVGTFRSDHTSATGSIQFNMQGNVSADNATIVGASEANAWMAAQNTAGTPVTLYYPLANPVVTLGDPVFIPQVPGITNILTNGAVKGQISASVLVPRP